MVQKKINISEMTNSDGCFDLQFRKDTRRERTNSPTYYRWKTQFIITLPKEKEKILNLVKKELECGEVHVIRDQARFSVQKINDIATIIVPFFKKNSLTGNKKKDFQLWAKGAEIIFRNKGKHLAVWKKSELLQLIEIQKSSAKYKKQKRNLKWIDMAKAVAKI